MIDVHAPLQLVRPRGPRQALCVLEPRLGVVVHVGRALAHDDEVRELERRLFQHGREIEGAPGDLHANFVDQRGRQNRHETANSRLISCEVVARRARRRRGAAAPAEEIVRIGIEKVVPDRQGVIRGRMVIQLQHERVIVVLLQLIRGFLRQTELGAHGVEGRQVVLDHTREPVRLLAQLPFVVAEEERSILGDWRPERQPELVLVEHVAFGRIEDRPCVQLVVHPEVVQ